MRAMQKGRYVFVLIATAAVFSLGLLMGVVINEKKADVMDRMNAGQNLDDLSLNLQFMYINSLDVNSSEGCKVMNAALEQSWANLDDAYNKMVKYKDSNDANPDTVRLVERNSLLNNLRYWFLLKRAKSSCELDDSVSALFFFREESCDECGVQSTMLEHYKRIFDDRFLLFHVNVGIDEPMVRLLLDQYEVSKYPTVVIDSEKFTGVMGKDGLKGVICSKFKSEQPECGS